MDKKPRSRLFIDQYGGRHYARSVKDLYEQLGRSRAQRMYRDTKQGTMHVGYVVGPYWCAEYAPVMRKV